MTFLLRHRGPDAVGFGIFSLRQGAGRGVPSFEGRQDGFEGGIGVQRLRIRELGGRSDQPLWARGGRVLVGFNGEIYNADEQRSCLRKEGFEFQGHSDTEVILALYQHHGFEGTLQRLEGMFALALVDLTKRRLFLVRDRLGIKPLYWYRSSGGTLIFASEIKAFLAHPEFRAELDEERLEEFLLFRYCVGESGLLKNVKLLQPGCWMKIDPRGCDGSRYWGLPPRRTLAETRGRETAEALGDELAAAVERQLVADVGIGCQLSGGVDSSLVTLFAAGARDDLPAYSVIPDDPRHSEVAWIDQALRTAGARGRRYSLDSSFMLRNLQRATWHLDLPASHPNSLGLLLMAREAGDEVRVLLSGEGADELLGGYTRMLYAHLLPRISSTLPWVRWLPGIGAKLQERFQSARQDPAGWFLLESAFVTLDQLSRLRPGPAPDRALSWRRDLFRRQHGTFFDRGQRYEMQTYLPDLLLRQDKMGMAHAVEVRVPYLDDRFVEHCLSLPVDRLVGGRPLPGMFRRVNTKVLLKRLAARRFGFAFAYRPKRGFSLPLAGYLRSAEFRAFVEDSVLPATKRRGLLESGAMTGWWKALQAGDDSPQEAFWIGLAFELWAGLFLEGGWQEVYSADSRNRGQIVSVVR